MPITIQKFVDVQSGVAGGAVVRARELVGRVLSTSSALQPGVVVEFDSLNDVGSVFATNSPEYRLAASYFGFVSKMNSGARKLSMGRWTKTAAAAQITGGPGVLGSSILDSVKLTKSLLLRLTDDQGATSNVTITVDFSAAGTYDAVRSILQTALRANASPQLTQANVLYTASLGSFTIQSGAPAVAGRIDAVAGPNEALDVGFWLNLLPGRGAVTSSQFDAQSPLDAIVSSVSVSDNFGSFAYLDSTVTPMVPLPQVDVEAVSAWNHAQNNRFLMCALTTAAVGPAVSEAIRGNSGASLSLADNDFAEIVPMIIFASTDYDRENASTNYMYQQFGSMRPTVNDTPLSNRMDASRINYIGQTMSAGQNIAFYQRGVLMGDATAAVDMSTYVNEIWLKDSITTNMLAAQLALPRIPANDAGRAIILTNIQYSITAALKNGVISVGKLLTARQRQAVSLLTGDPDAWQQLQTLGYWINVTIKEVTTVDGRTEYVAVYQLVYAKDDQIRKVEGSNTLI